MSKNHYIDLLCKSMNFFLYDRDLLHERINCLFENNHCVKHARIRFLRKKPHSLVFCPVNFLIVKKLFLIFSITMQWFDNNVNRFWPIFLFYTSWKQKLLGGIKWECWPEMGFSLPKNNMVKILIWVQSSN